MKLSISNIAWDPVDNLLVYELLKKYRFDGIEIAPTIWFPENPYEQLENAKIISYNLKHNFDLEVSSIQSICYGKNENIFGTENEFNELFNYVKKAIDFASSINCPNIVFGCPKNRIINTQDQLEIAYRFFNDLGSYASNKNIIISIEPNPTIYGTNFLNTTEQVIDFLKNLNQPSIKLNVDLGTIIYNHESIEILKLNKDLIGHIHLSEPNLERLNISALYNDLISLVSKMNYSKYISIEMKRQSLIDLEVTLKKVSEVFYDFK